MRTAAAFTLLFVSLLATPPGNLPAAGAAPGAPGAPPAAAACAFRDYVAFAEGRIGNSRPLWFLIDTGATRSALDSAVARELGLRAAGGTTVQGSAGTVAARAVTLPRLAVGDLLVARGIEPAVYDLSGSLAPRGRRRLAGILGFDVLKKYAVLFDAANGRVGFAASAAAFGDPGKAAVVPFELDDGIPRVNARIDGVPVRLRLDTGASLPPGPATFVNITQGFYERLKAADPALEPFRYFTARGTGGEIRLPVLRGKSLLLGGMEVAGPRLIVQPPVGYFARPDAVGFLGSYSLQSRSRFVVDYPRKRLLLFP